MTVHNSSTDGSCQYKLHDSIMLLLFTYLLCEKLRARQTSSSSSSSVSIKSAARNVRSMEGVLYARRHTHFPLWDPWSSPSLQPTDATYVLRRCFPICLQAQIATSMKTLNHPSVCSICDYSLPRMYSSACYLVLTILI